MNERMNEIAAQHGWVIEGEAAREGEAWRHSVRVQDGEGALFYAWDDPRAARRAAWCHDPANGAQLFVVPEIIESGEGWILLRGIEGRPLSEIASNPSELGADGPAILDSIGEALRKLHAITKSTVYGDVIGPDGDEAVQWLTFNGYVAAKFERYAEDVRTLDISDVEQAEMTARIGQMRHELAAFHPRSRCTLVHGKLAFEHIWIGEGGREVVALTGFDHAAHLPPEIDLAWLLWVTGCGADEALVRRFYRGYGAARTMDVQRRERFYRRMVAFSALYGELGESGMEASELIRLTEPVLD